MLKLSLQKFVIALLSIAALGGCSLTEGWGSSEQFVAPDPPTLSVTVVSSTQMDLSWTASVGADAYIVMIGNTPGSEQSYTTWATTSFSADHLTANTQYCWQVKAYNAGLEISDPSNEVCLTTPTDAFSPPATVTATAISNSRIEVAWSSVPNAFKYYVQSSTSSAGPFTHVGSILAPATDFTHVNLTPSTTYYYRVISVFPDGTESAPSALASATTFGGISPPTTVNAQAISDSRITVSWNAAPGAIKYYVLQSTAYAGPYNFIGSVLSPTTNLLAVNLSPSTNYCFKVMSVDSGQNESVPSEPPACTYTYGQGGGNAAGYWRFDERTGTTAYDSSGYFRHGTLSSTAAYSWLTKPQIDDDKSSLWTSSDPSSMVTVPNADAFNLASNFTVAFWAKPGAADVRFVGMRGGGCGTLAWEIAQDSTNGLYFAGENNQLVSFGTSLATTGWTHVAVTHAYGTMRLYLNGVEVGSAPYTASNSNPMNLTIGHVGGCAGGEGFMDDVQIYTRALSGAEIGVIGTLPPAPTNLVITNITSTSMDLSWDPVPGATAYIISKGSAPGNELFFTHTLNVTTFNGDHLNVNTQYSWTVRAVVNGLYSNPSNSAVGTTLAAPAAPLNVVATVVAPDRISVTWDPVPNAFKYYVFQSVNGGAYAFAGSVLSPRTDFLAVYLLPNTTYSYVVQAEDSVQTVGPLSAPASATTPP